MSNPSFSNIDMWLFELAEGNLSPEQVEQLELFLLNNPDLDVDRDVWEMAKVEKQTIPYPNVADLERKRRPVVFYAFSSLLLLLLIGSGSYIAFNYEADDFSEADLLEQKEQVKLALQKEIKNSANNGKNQNFTETAAIKNSIEKLYERNESSGTLVASNELSTTSSGSVNSGFVSSEEASLNRSEVRSGFDNRSGLNQNRTENSLGLPIYDMVVIPRPALELSNSRNSSLQNANESVTNLQEEGYVTELNEKEENSDEVGNEEFSVREPNEIDSKEGRVWIERTSNSDGQTIASSGGERRSFKERLNKFGRSLERMMSAPIALKNSRDPIYHVPGKTASDINFSSAGTLVATRVQATSRLQWLGQENEQFMNQVAIDGYSKDILGGWGVQLNHQWYKGGGIQVAQAAFTYSPKISVSNWVSVEPSVRFKMGNKQLNTSQLENTEMVELDRGNAREFYPNGAAPIGQSLWYKDLGVGLLVNTKWFFAGLQADNLFKHKDNLYDDNWSDPRTAQNDFTATIGTDWVSRNEKLTFSPYVVYQKNEKLSELWGGANFSYNWFNIGIAASSNLEPAASIGMKFDHFSLLYNADYTHSEMLGEKALSHQLTLRFVAKQNRFGKQLFKR